MIASDLQFIGVTKSDVHISQGKELKKVKWAEYKKMKNGENWTELGSTV